MIRVQYGKDVTSHSGPKSCGVAREGDAKALTGETGGSAIEPRNQKFGTPTPLCDAEGKTDQGDECESWDGPARSETMQAPGRFMHRSWEISAKPGATTPGNSGKAQCHKPEQPAAEKLNAFMLPEKPSNKGDNSAEMVEGRSAVKGNADRVSAPRTQSRTSCASMGLGGVREAARRDLCRLVGIDAAIPSLLSVDPQVFQSAFRINGYLSTVMPVLSALHLGCF